MRFDTLGATTEINAQQLPKRSTYTMNLITLALALGLLAAPSSADTLSGRIVDSNGQPVQGVNITAKRDSDGSNGNLMNGGTDAGGFFNATIESGTYRLTFDPPPPPAALGLTLCIDDQVVSGSTALGTLSLGAAAALSGHVTRPGGAAAVGVNLDVIDLASGDNLDIVGDFTDLQGDFLMAVPVGQIELRFDTTPVAGALLAPHALVVDTATDASLGTLALKPGFMISAALLGPGFLGIEDLDVDVVDATTGAKLYTPGDNSDINGFVDFVVSAGTYDFEFCPPNSSDFVAHIEKGIVVVGDMSFGIINLIQGLRLSGTVRDYLGQTQAGVDIDVRLAGSAQSVLVCADSSDGSGDYSVVLPSGNFDVSFTPSYALNLGSRVLSNLSVMGNLTRNPVLPFCGPGSSTGVGTPGSAGLVPSIASSGGSLRLGNPNWGFDVGNGLGGAYGVAVIGLSNDCQLRNPSGVVSGSPQPLNRQVRAIHRRLIQLDGTQGLAGSGQAHVGFPIPNDLALAGLNVVVRVQIFDPAAFRGRASSALLCGQLCQ